MGEIGAYSGNNMAHAPNGQAVSAARRTPEAIAGLRRFRDEREAAGDLGPWRRSQAVLRYIEGEPAIALAKQLGVDRSSVARWLIWYDEGGVDSLLTARQPGARPKLDDEDRDRLFDVMKAGPQACGFSSGIWTGPMAAELIQRTFGVTYHHHSISRLLREVGLSVQRPRKRLARADPDAQKAWIDQRFPEIKKKPSRRMGSFFSKMK